MGWPDLRAAHISRGIHAGGIEGEVQIQEEDTSRITTLICRAPIKSNHNAYTKKQNGATYKACNHQPFSSGVVKEDGIDGVADKSFGQPSSRECETSRSTMSESCIQGRSVVVDDGSSCPFPLTRHGEEGSPRGWQVTLKFYLSANLSKFSPSCMVVGITGVSVDTPQNSLSSFMLIVIDEPSGTLRNEVDTTSEDKRRDVALAQGIAP
ncbi:hypothetical protein DER44DRAFT_862910 [Fusarium oxysporum]|nr:hypothetical protein DER44DRAFT_862910 [Fusarium oxysporum]